MRRYLVTRKEAFTVALSGTSGTANINISGTNYLATFTTDLATSAANFVTASAATILAAKGYVVTHLGGGVLQFRANVSGVDSSAPTVANATGTLAGTVVNTKAQANYEIFTSGLDVNGGGNVSIFQIKNRDTGVLVDQAEKIKKLNYHEGDLIAIATSEDFTLVSTLSDGTGAVTKRAES